MPLQRSGSKAAFSRNVAEMMGAGHPQDQALAAAYRIKRQARGAGGEVNDVHVGPIISTVPGRTDHHPMDVPSGAYVVPAEVVNHLGQGNTLAGMKVLEHMFSDDGSLDIGKRRGKRARGGRSEQSSVGEPVPIMAAGGEYVIPPDVVAAIGAGDIKRGHAILDGWVVQNHKKHAETIRKLPGPAKS